MAPLTLQRCACLLDALVQRHDLLREAEGLRVLVALGLGVLRARAVDLLLAVVPEKTRWRE